MSIANVYLGADFALIGSDTAGRPIDENNKPTGEPDFSMCKLMPIPLSNAVLACRGERGFYSYLWTQLVFNDRGSFDAMADNLHLAIEETVRVARLSQANPEVAGNWLLVGWSERLGRMRCVSAECDGVKLHLEDSADGWGMNLAPGLSPDDCNGQPVPTADTAEAMMACAGFQVRMVQADPGQSQQFSIGGDLLLARVERGRLTIENLGPISPS